MHERLLPIYDSKESLNTNKLEVLLPPLNTGTPFVESMTSYLSRLAKYCDIDFTRLVKTVASYKNDFGDPTEGETETWIQSCNGISTLAENLSFCLQKLTLRNEFDYLSMVRWKKIISPDKDGMFKKHRAWCAHCIHEWQQKDMLIHEPLIWSLKNVEICLLHTTPLTQVCPLCEKLQAYAYHKRGIGYCTSCGCRISGMRPSDLTIYPTSYKELVGDQGNWFENSIGALLSVSSSISSGLKITSITSFLNKKAEQHANGDMAKLGLLLGFEEKELIRWASGSTLLQFDQLVDLTYRLNIFPSEMIIEEDNIIETRREVRNAMSAKNVMAKFRKYDDSEIKRLLEFFIALRHPWPIELIAKVLNCSEGYLRFTFPVQTRRLEEKHIDRVGNEGTKKCRDEYAKAIRSVFSNEHDQTSMKESVVPNQIINCRIKNGVRREFKMRRHVMKELASYDRYKVLREKDISPSAYLSLPKELREKRGRKADLKNIETTINRQFGQETVTIRRVEDNRVEILPLPKGLRGLKVDEDDWSHIEAIIRKDHEEETVRARALEEIRTAKIIEDNWHYQQKWDCLQKYRTYKW